MITTELCILIAVISAIGTAGLCIAFYELGMWWARHKISKMEDRRAAQKALDYFRDISGDLVVTNENADKAKRIEIYLMGKVD